jgi:hypothetical protein
MRGNPEGFVFVGAHGRAPLAETEQSRSRIFFRKHESALPCAHSAIQQTLYRLLSLTGFSQLSITQSMKRR